MATGFAAKNKIGKVGKGGGGIKNGERYSNARHTFAFNI
jgi:hypothetical protein